MLWERRFGRLSFCLAVVTREMVSGLGVNLCCNGEVGIFGFRIWRKGVFDVRNDVFFGLGRVDDGAPEAHTPTQELSLVSGVLFIEDPDRPLSDGVFFPASKMSARHTREEWI